MALVTPVLKFSKEWMCCFWISRDMFTIGVCWKDIMAALVCRKNTYDGSSLILNTPVWPLMKLNAPHLFYKNKKTSWKYFGRVKAKVG